MSGYSRRCIGAFPFGQPLRGWLRPNGNGPAMLQAGPHPIHFSWSRWRLAAEEELNPNTPAADSERGGGWVLCFHFQGGFCCGLVA